MESDLQHQQQKQMNSGLMRYQSAPSSYFSGFLDREFCEDLLNRPSSPETERIFARFLSNTGGNIKQDSPVREVGITASMNNNNNHDDDDDDKAQIKFQQQQHHPMNNYSYQKPPLPDQNSGSGMNYRAVPSMGMERCPPMKTSSGGGGNNLNLVRHSSSPAGLFSNISIEFENEYAVLRGMGDFGAVNKETSYSAATRPLASPGPMSPIAEMGDRIMPENVPDNNGGFSETRGSNYVTGFPVGSWDESSIMPAHDKRLTDEDRSLSGLNASETQSGETGNRPPVLAHHLSLPKTSAEISAIEKFLQFQDSVPCKIRAKRGCATHPRSIAERVRRTRISERMRKLQELVPNMDKQTNTADMLDLAVDYIKDLQREVKALSENRANCRCTNKRLP